MARFSSLTNIGAHCSKWVHDNAIKITSVKTSSDCQGGNAVNLFRWHHADRSFCFCVHYSGHAWHTFSKSTLHRCVNNILVWRKKKKKHDSHKQMIFQTWRCVQSVMIGLPGAPRTRLLHTLRFCPAPQIPVCVRFHSRRCKPQHCISDPQLSKAEASRIPPIVVQQSGFKWTWFWFCLLFFFFVCFFLAQPAVSPVEWRHHCKFIHQPFTRFFPADLHWQCGHIHEPLQVAAHLQPRESGRVSQQKLLWT